MDPSLSGRAFGLCPIQRVCSAGDFLKFDLKDRLTESGEALPIDRCRLEQFPLLLTQSGLAPVERIDDGGSRLCGGHRIRVRQMGGSTGTPRTCPSTVLQARYQEWPRISRRRSARDDGSLAVGCEQADRPRRAHLCIVCTPLRKVCTVGVASRHARRSIPFTSFTGWVESEAPAPRTILPSARIPPVRRRRTCGSRP